MEFDLQQQPYFYGASEPPIGSADVRKTVGQDHQHGKHDWIDARCEHGCVRRNKGSDSQSYCGVIQGSWNARSNCQRDQPWPDQQYWRPILASDDGGGSWVVIRTCARSLRRRRSCSGEGKSASAGSRGCGHEQHILEMATLEGKGFSA